MKKLIEIYCKTLDEAVKTLIENKAFYDSKKIETLISIHETNRPVRWRVEVWGEAKY